MQSGSRLSLECMLYFITNVFACFFLLFVFYLNSLDRDHKDQGIQTEIPMIGYTWIQKPLPYSELRIRKYSTKPCCLHVLSWNHYDYQYTLLLLKFCWGPGKMTLQFVFFSWRPEFSFQHSYEKLIAFCNTSSRVSNTLFWSQELHAHGTQIYIRA